ncbi:MAG TPA: hypothetical protein VIO94_07655 [Phenylobacterium sp.]
MLKGLGYLVSTVSVLLLGLVAWDGTKGDEGLRLALIGGMAASILGMLLRWAAHRRSEAAKPAHKPAEAKRRDELAA